MSIGVGYNFAKEDPQKISVNEFIAEIIRASVLVETENVCLLLDSWKNRLSMPLTLKCKIFGISVCKTIPLNNKSRILPSNSLSQEDLKIESVRLGYIFKDAPIRKNLENLDSLVIDLEIPYGLYSPSNIQDHKENWKKIEIAKGKAKYLCEALSLASATNVSFEFSWFDAGKTALFFGENSVNYLQYDKRNNIEQISTELEDQTKFYLCKRANLCKYESREMNSAVDISIYRLVESMNLSDDLDKVNRCCIELRIALESLFKFRSKFDKIWENISASCACLLEENPSEKSEYYQKIKDFYSVASSILHAREGQKTKSFINRVEKVRKDLFANEKKPTKQKLEKELLNQKIISLKEAQRVLLLAINDVLNRGSIPCWDKMLQEHKSKFPYLKLEGKNSQKRGRRKK